MANDPSGNDPRRIWQSQPSGISAATLEKMMRRRAEELHAKTLRERLGTLAGPLSTGVISALGIALDHNPAQRVAFAIAVAWSVAGVYVLNRGIWRVTLPGDGATATGLEFCRKEIERQIHFHNRFLLWCFAPIVLAMGALVVPLLKNDFGRGGALSKMSPFLSLFALWVILIFVFRNRGWRALQREVDELNDIEKETRT